MAQPVMENKITNARIATANLSNPQNQPIPEATKQTNHMERFNCTLRQRVARLVRKTLSFSKKLDNHIAMIWLFVHHYNTLIQSKILIIPS